MTKATMVVMLMTTFLATGAGSLRAQGQAAPGSDMFLSIDVGAQPQQRTIATSSSFPLYDETATITTHQDVHNGAVFGVTGGYRIKPRLALALGFSMFKSRAAESAVDASIPDLVFFGRPKSVSATTSGLKRSDQALHVQVVWFHPVRPKIEIVLAGGPSVLYVHQDLATDVSVAPGTQIITVRTDNQVHGGLGFNAGFEGNYFFNPRYGAGLFVRYAGGKVDLPSVQDLQVGGIQVGLGVRIRFDF